MAEITFTCHCFSGKAYFDCCELVHKGKLTEVSAEQVMRARYTAFCYHNAGYIVSTIHPGRRRFNEAFAMSRAVKKTRWIGLRVIDHQAGDEVSYVEFIAYYIKKGEIEQQHERSKFVFVKGRWFYFGGEELPPVKLERNEPCFCGSGKKFKKCHKTLPGKLGSK